MESKKRNYNIIFVFGAFISGILASTAFLLHFNQNFLYPALAISNSTINDNTQSIPAAKSVFDTGIMSLPTSVSGYIIDIPDEAHHPLSDNKTMSLKNAHYVPSDLEIPSGTAIAFVHGDPNHIHSEIIKDASTGNITWQTKLNI